MFILKSTPVKFENHSNMFYSRDHECSRNKGKFKVGLRNPSEGTPEE